MDAIFTVWKVFATMPEESRPAGTPLAKIPPQVTPRMNTASSLEILVRHAECYRSIEYRDILPEEQVLLKLYSTVADPPLTMRGHAMAQECAEFLLGVFQKNLFQRLVVRVADSINSRQTSEHFLGRVSGQPNVQITSPTMLLTEYGWSNLHEEENATVFRNRLERVNEYQRRYLQIPGTLLITFCHTRVMSGLNQLRRDHLTDNEQDHFIHCGMLITELTEEGRFVVHASNISAPGILTRELFGGALIFS
jgi:hypothetical protein